MLSLRFSLSLLVGLLLASSGSAISYSYDMTGSTMNTYQRGSAFPTVTYPNPSWLCTFP